MPLVQSRHYFNGRSELPRVLKYATSGKSGLSRLFRQPFVQKRKGRDIRSSEANIWMPRQLGSCRQLEDPTGSLSSSLDVALEVGSPCQGQIPAEDLRAE